MHIIRTSDDNRKWRISSKIRMIKFVPTDNFQIFRKEIVEIALKEKKNALVFHSESDRKIS